jgi:hypothetical protein
MKNLLIIVVLYFITVSFPAISESEAYRITGSKGLFYYDGRINSKGVQELISTYTFKSNSKNWLKVRSAGGDVSSAIDLSFWIIDNNLNIVIEDYCLSSCANYIFTSANEKKILNSALIAFHGGISSAEFDMSSITEFSKAMEKKKRDLFLKETKQKFDKYIQENIEKESTLFNLNGVQVDITKIGQDLKYDYIYRDNPNYKGWMYTKEALLCLGVKNIEIVNPPWNPINSSKSSNFFILNVEDILESGRTCSK